MYSWIIAFFGLFCFCFCLSILPVSVFLFKSIIYLQLKLLVIKKNLFRPPYNFFLCFILILCLIPSITAFFYIWFIFPFFFVVKNFYPLLTAFCIRFVNIFSVFILGVTFNILCLIPSITALFCA